MATERFDTAHAPDELRLTQELLNTTGIPRLAVPDLLGDLPTAQPWWESVVVPGAWAPPAITERDLAELRDLREAAASCLVTGPGTGRPLRGLVQLSVGRDGMDEAAPVAGSPAGRVEAGLLGERLRAEAHDSWDRLKICANPDCPVAFFDRSRNRSAIWHSSDGCGNKMNLRRMRARRAKP